MIKLYIYLLLLYFTCSEALTVHMTSLECHTDDELESTVGDLDEATDTETESMSDGTLCSYTMTCKQYQVDATKFLDDCLHCIVTLLLSTHTHTPV